MIIKDFKPGNTAYSLIRGNYNTDTKYHIDEYVVVSIGRKYVKAAPKNLQNYPKKILPEQHH